MSSDSSGLYQVGAAILLSLAVCSTAQAGNGVKARVDAAGVAFSTSKNHAGATITVTGPNGYRLTQKGASIGDLGVNGQLADGVYKYEVTLTPMIKRARRNGDENSMHVKRSPDNIGSGTFRVLNGEIVNPKDKE